MGKKGVFKKPARKLTRVACLPDWARTCGISVEEWEDGTKPQRQQWRRNFQYVPAAGSPEASGDDSPSDTCDGGEVIGMEHKVFYQQYSICGLDLSVAREALLLHRWEDAHCLRKLMEILEAGHGNMTLKTFFMSELNLGRLYLEWPTLLHANKEFRACLLYPQSEQWTDLDMTNAHCYICLYLSGLVGLRLPALLDYIDQKKIYREVLTEQGVCDRDAKQLWLSLLNSGTVGGWRHKVRQAAPGLKVSFDGAGLGTHLKELRKEIVSLRSRIFETRPWAKIFQDMEAQNIKDTRHQRGINPWLAKPLVRSCVFAIHNG